MTQRYTWSGFKDYSIPVTGLALTGALLSLPWIAYYAVNWIRHNPIPPSTSEVLHQKALKTGWEAAKAAQTAKDQRDWQQISQQWEDAIALLQGAQAASSKPFPDTQTKIAEYRANQQYANERAETLPPEFTWEKVTELAGAKSYILIDPNSNDSISPGPPLKINADQVITNTAYLNQVLASLKLPPLGQTELAPGKEIQVKNNQYIVKNYPLGELSLYQTLCRDSFEFNRQYDCLWKITLR